MMTYSDDALAKVASTSMEERKKMEDLIAKNNQEDEDIVPDMSQNHDQQQN
jgi:hypothetical protein